MERVPLEPQPLSILHPPKFLAPAAHDLAVRAARLERAVQLNAITKLGISVLDWQISRPLDVLLRQTARDMANKRNL